MITNPDCRRARIIGVSDLEIHQFMGTLAIEASAKIYNMGKTFNRLTIEKVVKDNLVELYKLLKK